MSAVGRLSAVIVPGHGEKAALGRCPLEVAQLQGFAGPIDAHALAVPESEHALENRFSEPLELLSAAERTHRKLLVQARHEADVMGVEQLLGGPSCGVVDPQR